MIRRREPPSPEAARARALRLLARREHSQRELSRKLAAGGVDAQDAGEIVGGLAEAGWQSDTRYADSLVRQRVSQGFGPLRITADMRVAGVDEAEIRRALDAADVDWADLARRVWSRRFDEAADLAERQKQYRFLAGRGFAGRDIARVLKGELPDEGDGPDDSD